MFVWTSGFQNPLAHTHFNMFVDEWTSANESPEGWNPLRIEPPVDRQTGVKTLPCPKLHLQAFVALRKC